MTYVNFYRPRKIALDATLYKFFSSIWHKLHQLLPAFR